MVRRVAVLGGLVLGGGLTITVAAWQATPAAQVIDVVKVKDNLYVLTSSSPSDRPAFSGGNVAVFHRFGVTVEAVVHENTRANMARMDAFKDAGARFLPARTFTDTLSLGAGRDRIDLYHFGPGHTTGDAFVVFPALGVMHTGDMFAWKDAPFIDRANDGLPQTLAKLLGTVKGVDTIIPGHTPVTGWADLQEFQRFTHDLLTAATAARAAGRTVEAAAASLDLSSRYPGYKSERVQAAVQAIYDELAGSTP